MVGKVNSHLSLFVHLAIDDNCAILRMFLSVLDFEELTVSRLHRFHVKSENSLNAYRSPSGECLEDSCAHVLLPQRRGRGWSRNRNNANETLRGQFQELER